MDWDQSTVVLFWGHSQRGHDCFPQTTAIPIPLFFYKGINVKLDKLI